MSYHQKMNIMSNEVTRRLSNVDHEKMGNEEIVKVLEQLTQELKNSRYKVEQTREILISGVRSWKKRIERRRDSGMYRHAQDTLEEREKKKLIVRESWFLPRPSSEGEEKSGIDGRKILRGKRRSKLKKIDIKNGKTGLKKAVMFAPYTAGSALTKELREAENKLGDSTGIKVKIVERCGTKIVDILTSSDPWKGQDCLRAGCLLCQTKSYTGKHLSQDCRKRSIVYETRCITYEERKIKEIEEKFENEEDEKVKKEEISKIKILKYIGKTSKSCYERGWQHLSDAAQLKPSSHILKHYLDNHEDEEL